MTPLLFLVYGLIALGLLLLAGLIVCMLRSIDRAGRLRQFNHAGEPPRGPQR